MTAIEFRRVSYHAAGRVELRGVDFSASPGDCIVVFGRSGSGKRALVKLVSGALRPTEGAVASGPGPLPAGYVASDGGLLSNLSLLENVVLPVVYHRRLARPAALTAARALLEELGVADQADNLPARSGVGARRLAQVARAMLAEPAAYVFDEPLDELDAAAARKMREVLRGLKDGRRAAVFISTGRLKAFLDWGERFFLLSEGGLTVFETRAALLESADPEVRLFLD